MRTFDPVRIVRRDLVPFEPGSLSRMQFVAGTVGLLLAGCSGGSTTSIVPAGASAAPLDMQALTALMKAAGVRAVLDKGVLYGADGSVTQVGPAGPNSRHAACVIYNGVGRATKTTCEDTSGGSAQTGDIVCDDGDLSDPWSQWSGDGGDFGGYLGYGVSPVYYWDAIAVAQQRQQGPNSCGVLFAAAAAGGLNMAGQIVKMAPRFPPAMVNAAQTAVNNWQGTTVGAGAALEFIGLTATGVVFSDFLGLLAAVVGGGAAIYAAVQCLRNQG